jgi:multidrug efflux pump subunit AcrB
VASWFEVAYTGDRRMNALVLVALKRPYTFVVLAILILLFGTISILKTATDIFPPIKIPVIAAIWTYNGLSPADMSGRVIYYYERALTTTVSGIQHIESQSYYGSGVVKIYFQPGTDIAAAQAQVTAVSQTVIKQMPAGITPPNILVFDASSVPVLDLQVAADNMTPSQINDITSNLIRPALISVPGVAIPAPYGGTTSDVEVDLNQAELLAHGLSAKDVGAALALQNIVLPAGDQKIGPIDFMVTTNSTPLRIEQFNNLPIKKVGNATVYLRDVAYVHQGGPPQQNIVMVKGQQAILLEVLKTGDASTLAVVAGVRAKLPGLLKTLPPGITITPLNDASQFVLASIEDVVQEMVTAAILAGLAVLIFVGSWRSTLIVAASIPLSILSSIICLAAVGQDINVMTLGGMALAVGILVDDATVMIENINAHLEAAEQSGGEVNLRTAIIEASNQIVVPTFVSTTCICIVWLPLLQLGGVSGYLFLPLAEAVIFAMVASFILSRTLTPTMADFLLRGQVAALHAKQEPTRKRNVFSRFHRGFETGFERFRESHRRLLERLAPRRGLFSAVYLTLALASLSLLVFVGQDFFPGIKSGELHLHMRFASGTRIEETAKLAVLVDQQVHQLLPDHVIGSLLNCGLPSTGINQAYSTSGTVGSQDCDLSVSLDNQASPVDAYQRTLRAGLAERFPGTQFSFLPGDITAQILNFGLPAPIDIQISGRDLDANYAFAVKMAARIRKVAGSADVRIQQIMDQPTLQLDTNRSLALGIGVNEALIADNVLATLSGSGQTAPTYWLDAKTGVAHLVNVQTPQVQMRSINDLRSIPISDTTGIGPTAQPGIVGGVAVLSTTAIPGVVSHSSIMPVIDIYANVAGRDLGAVSRAMQIVIDDMRPELPKGATVALTGQAPTMLAAYTQLLEGLALSIVLVFLVIVVNFQSWADPLVVISALPAALAGVTWSLFLTGTTLSVPALTGAIMCMGTATANTVLVVDFARAQLAAHGDAVAAAIEAGHARIRPVMMTALAMIVGMFPMSLSNTTNAPLGRAVIGGLIVATATTLVFVPCVFAIIHSRRGARQPSQPQEQAA